METPPAATSTNDDSTHEPSVVNGNTDNDNIDDNVDDNVESNKVVQEEANEKEKLETNDDNTNTDITALSLLNKELPILPSYSPSSIQKGMKFLKLKLADVNSSLRTIEDFSKAKEPKDFGELRFESYKRKCQSNLKVLMKFLRKDALYQKEKEKTTKAMQKLHHSKQHNKSQEEEDDDVDLKLKIAHQHLQASKLRVRKRALKKFQVERQLELSKKKLLENAEKHTNIVHEREKKYKKESKNIVKRKRE